MDEIRIKVDTTRFNKNLRRATQSLRRMERAFLVAPYRENPALNPSRPYDREALDHLKNHPDVLEALTDAQA